MTSLSLFTFMHWRRKWQPTPVFLPGQSQGRERLLGCRTERVTERQQTGDRQGREDGIRSETDTLAQPVTHLRGSGAGTLGVPLGGTRRVGSNSVPPHRRQPTRLPRPWDSPGKNTGVGCHFLLQCMEVKSESEVIQSCLTLRDPMDCSLPGSSIHGIFQARILEWGTIAFSAFFLLLLLLLSHFSHVRLCVTP